MSEEANRTSSGLFMPYPLLGMLLTLVLALGGGIIGLYATVNTMNATMLMRDADYSQRTRRLEEKLELQDLKIADLKEKLIRVEVSKKGG